MKHYDIIVCIASHHLVAALLLVELSVRVLATAVIKPLLVVEKRLLSRLYPRTLHLSMTLLRLDPMLVEAHIIVRVPAKGTKLEQKHGH